MVTDLLVIMFTDFVGYYGYCVYICYHGYRRSDVCIMYITVAMYVLNGVNVSRS